MANFVAYNNDQRREMVNTRQRFQAWREAALREHGYRGSMVWEETQNKEYLLRAYYDEHGKRRQKSLGRRGEKTEEIKKRFETERKSAQAERKRLEESLNRQAAINRVLGIGRVPMTAARILRSLDRKGLLGHGIRIVGTNALYAYEAACGVFIDPEITTTGDIDLLFDARARLRLIFDSEISESSLIGILQSTDKSFKKSAQAYRASNDEGYIVDVIAPDRNPPWKNVSKAPASDIEAAPIGGLIWLENAPSFEQIALDEKGYPLLMVTVDPRVFAIHKHWVSGRVDRDPLKKTRDLAQAKTVSELVASYLPNLEFDASQMLMIPHTVVENALACFSSRSAS